MAALSEQKGQLQPTHSSRSTGSTSTFIAACPPGALDPPGLSPVAKVYVRPASGKRPKKPSALDRHLRHVVLLQRSNRNKAHQHAATTQQKHKQHQRFLDWGHRLRSAILQGEDTNSSTSTDSRQGSSSPEPEQLTTAPAQQHADCADTRHDIIQSWKPVAAAAQTRELQESLAKQQRRLRKLLPHVLDPNTLRPDYQIQQQQLLQMQEEEGYSTGLYSSISLAAHKAAALQSPGKSGNHMSGLGGRSTAAAGQGQLQQDDADGSLDVDSFLDGLLQQASAATTTPAQQKTAAGKAAPSTKPQQQPTSQSPQQQHDKTQDAQHSQHSLQDSPKQRPASSCSKRGQRAVPAWAVSEAAAAQAEAAAAEEEEESLLEFAEGLDWQELLQDLGDDELAAAFKDLELADAAAAEGQADADKRWQQCFVTALNAAAMKGISDTNAAVTAGTNSQQGDKHSFLSSASAIRRAEAAAARRQQLLRKLHRMAGTQPSADAAAAAAGGPLAAAGSAAGSVKAGSVCGSSTSSRLGPGGCMSLAAAAAAGADAWDSSTVVSNGAEDVGRLRCAIKHLEAGEVLTENPDMKGVHSTASVRSMLSKMEAA